MKKLILAIAAVALIASPALAVDWNFYGSARMATYWNDDDFGDFENRFGDDSDEDLIWDFQGNSRIGATVKAENIKGQFELALKGSGTGDVDVGTRRLYGVWNFGAGQLKVGKDYTPVSQFISGQAFDGDLGLLGVGTMYGNRTGQISLSFGGFEIALIQPSSGLALGMTDGDVDEWFPKVEAKFGMAFDMFNFNVRGGYQTFEVENTTGVGDNTPDDVDVDSWTIGADAGVNFGPAYVKGAISLSQNPGDAAWHIPGLRTFTGGATIYTGGSSTDDNDVLMWALVGGFKFTDQLTFEGGFGYRSDDPDVNGAQEDEVWEAYIQALITLAPGVYLVPEIGYTDYMDFVADINDDDEGDRWYAGAKWQIDF
jgi:hypothetical protein